jgi:hypothetical protein
MAFWILLAELVFAQPAPAPAPTATAVAAPAAAAQTVWMLRDTESKRFPDDAVVGPIFADGEAVEVLVMEADRARVRYGDRYGWVDRTSFTTEAPAAPTLDLGALGFDLNLPQLPAPSENKASAP